MLQLTADYCIVILRYRAMHRLKETSDNHLPCLTDLAHSSLVPGVLPSQLGSLSNGATHVQNKSKYMAQSGCSRQRSAKVSLKAQSLDGISNAYSAVASACDQQGPLFTSTYTPPSVVLTLAKRAIMLSGFLPDIHGHTAAAKFGLCGASKSPASISECGLYDGLRCIGKMTE